MTRLIDQEAWSESPGGGYDPGAVEDLPTYDDAPPQEQYDQPAAEGDWQPEPLRPAPPQYAAEQYVAQSPLLAQMGEAQRRFSKATYYQELLNGSFFSSTDEIGAEVETELKAFVEAKLGALLGLDVPQPNGGVGQFEDEEVAVLKAIVSEMRRKKMVPKSEAAKPAAPPERPRLQPRPAPAAARPTPPQRQQPRPQARPPARPPQQPRPTQPPARPQAPQGVAPPSPKGGFPPEGSLVKEGGRTYKIKHQSMYPSEMTDRLRYQMERMPIGRFTVLPDGLYVRRDGPEDWTKALRLNVTRQVLGEGGTPFPSDPSQMAAVSLMRSSEAVSSLSAKAQNVALTVGASSSPDFT